MAERITRFTDTAPAAPGDRLDEIVLTGDVHLEMMGATVDKRAKRVPSRSIPKKVRGA